MLRREWLRKNPPPASSGELLDRAAVLDAQDKKAEGSLLRQQAAASPAKCPQHPAAVLYRHQNRQEDLFVCKQGPHFLLWTFQDGRAQLVPQTKLDPPDLDGELV